MGLLFLENLKGVMRMKINDETTTREALEILNSYVDLMFTDGTDGDEKSDFEKALRKAILVLDHESDYGFVIDWLFSYINNSCFKIDNELNFEKVEKAIGFKLSYWQKSYIMSEQFQGYKKIIAKVLRDLLTNVDEKPLNLLTVTSVQYKNELFQMKEKLDKAGIKTRNIVGY